MGNLSQPFDPAVHVPWDCLDSLMVSVEGCMVSMVSTVPMSETLYNFSCTWLQLQGNLMNETHARMASWLRPSPVARYVLRSADLEIAAADITNPPKPLGWQEVLENMIRESSVLIADPAKPGLVMLSQNGGQCNATFQVKSGGLMGVGQVNRTTLGMIIMPSVAPYTRPFIIQGERSRWWTARARAVVIALFVMVGVFGLQLLSCIGILIYRMVKAGKQKRNTARTMITTTPFEDGIGQYHVGLGQPPEIGHGASSLEDQARRHGTTGGL